MLKRTTWWGDTCHHIKQATIWLKPLFSIGSCCSNAVHVKSILRAILCHLTDCLCLTVAKAPQLLYYSWGQVVSWGLTINEFSAPDDNLFANHTRYYKHTVIDYLRAYSCKWPLLQQACYQRHQLTDNGTQHIRTTSSLPFVFLVGSVFCFVLEAASKAAAAFFFLFNTFLKNAALSSKP